MALRLIAKWLEHHPEERFVVAATTSTGFRLAEMEAPDGVRVIYSPLDLFLTLRHTFSRFEPALIVLIDSELWPNLLHFAGRRGIPVALVNARLSPRSARRYERFRVITVPLLSQLKLVCAQAVEHAPSPAAASEEVLALLPHPAFVEVRLLQQPWPWPQQA